MASPDATRRLLALQDRLHAEWATDSQSLAFRIFAGEQRAIGEALIVGEGPQSRCMGYGAFLAAFAPGQNGLLDTLRADVATLGTNLAGAQDRLVQIQHTLIDILDLMDPDSLRFPPTSRSKA